MLEPYQRALALVGVTFRPQGRDPEIGLDCIGLVIEAFQLSPVELPRYRLTDGNWLEVERALDPWFDRSAEVGGTNDMVVCRLPRCFHFGVLGREHLIHADLTAGRVVARRLPAQLGSETRYYRHREGQS